MPFYEGGLLAVTTALGMPAKAERARRNPRVALLFSDATGAGIDHTSMILVQGTAEVADHDLDANRQRYRDDTAAKPTGPAEVPSGRRHDWYFTRIYIQVRPERVLVWRDGDCGARPDVYGELPRYSEVEEGSHGGVLRPDRRIAEIGGRYATPLLSLVAPPPPPVSLRGPMAAHPRGPPVARHLR